MFTLSIHDSFCCLLGHRILFQFQETCLSEIRVYMLCSKPPHPCDLDTTDRFPVLSCMQLPCLLVISLTLGHSSCGAATKSCQSCSTLCDPIDGSPPSSPVPGILQARTLEWVAIIFSNAWKWKVKSLSPVRLLATPRLQPTRLLRPLDFPGKSTGVGCHCLLLYLKEDHLNLKKIPW